MVFHGCHRGSHGSVQGAGALLLDHALGVYNPDLIVLVLVILETVAQLRLGAGFGGGAGFLNNAVGIYQVLVAVQLYRNVAQVLVGFLAQAVDIQNVILDPCLLYTSCRNRQVA